MNTTPRHPDRDLSITRADAVGFYVMRRGDMRAGSMSEILGAFTNLDEALSFIRARMADA